MKTTMFTLTLGLAIAAGLGLSAVQAQQADVPPEIGADTLADTLADTRPMRPDFAQLDVDGDGLVTSAELVAHMQATMPERRAARMLDRLDTDGDGAISATEFARMQGRMHDRMQERMGGRMDHDRNGWFGHGGDGAGQMRGQHGPRDRG